MIQQWVAHISAVKFGGFLYHRKPVVTSSLVEDWCIFKPVVKGIFQAEMVRC